MIRQGFDSPRLHLIFMSRKICIYCGKRKNKKSFPKHISHKDNLDSRCRSCIKRNTKVRNKLHKKAPPKPENELCECCSIQVKKWILDHDHNDNSFRGWLCDRCNTGLGKFDDNINGIINALQYLLIRSEIAPKELDIFIPKIIVILNNLLERKNLLDGVDNADAL